MAKKHSKRRSNGEGGISYNKTSKRWVVAYQIGIRDDGKPIKKYPTFDTEREAVCALRELQMLYPMGGGGSSLDTDITVGEWLDFWLDRYKKAKLKDTTLGSYECRVRQIKKRLGGVKLIKLSEAQIQAMVDDYSGRDKSWSTIMKDYSILNSALKVALKTGKIKANPIADVVLPSEKAKKERRVLSIEETGRFIQELDNENPLTKAAMLSYLVAGMRLGESLAQCWKHIDWENKVINIEQAVAIPHHKDAHKGQKAKPEIMEPKTESSKRDIYAPDLVFEALKVQKLAQQEFFKLHGREWTENEFIFLTKNYTVINPRNMQERAGRIFKALGIEGASIHALRRTYCTRGMESVQTPYQAKIISENMGHKELDLTINIYTQTSPKFKREAAINLNNMFSDIVKKDAVNV